MTRQLHIGDQIHGSDITPERVHARVVAMGSAGATSAELVDAFSISEHLATKLLLELHERGRIRTLPHRIKGSVHREHGGRPYMVYVACPGAAVEATC